MQQLRSIAEAHLAGRALSNGQMDFIRGLMESTNVQYAATKKYSGWYPRLFYRNIFDQFGSAGGDLDFQGSDRWDALITDVHTDPNGAGAVLHQTVGNVHLLMIAIESPTGVCVYAGPVLSHDEFYTDGLLRWSDADWKRRLVEKQIPQSYRSEWKQTYLVPGELTLPPDILSRP